ncbi:tetratricopeptide repeat protein [Brunnivagina elsteri]|uniref:tetratricopeptide repeat protein n=1 Tax=Brunnivagina elsteri TaxID=1247191 RepID=UPI002692D0C0
MIIRHFSIITTLSLSLIFSSSVLAQGKKQPTPDKFPPNPLEIRVSDPLLPRNPDKQPLTEQEKQQLEVALEQLNTDAIAKLESGDKLAAFDTWNREIRLRRYLGTIDEVQALSRVGEIAWRNNERPQVQFITQRLQSIQKPKKSLPVTDVAILQALGEGYQKVRSPKLAIEVYNQILATVRQQRNQTEEINTLQTIGTIHMSWFDYSQAAATYEELLGLASAKNVRIDELVYLKQLAYIYDQSKQHQQAINTRSKIAEIYTKENNLLELPELQIAIGSDYEILAKQNPSILENAFQNYQQAYITAWEQQQYARSGEALQKLIALYRSQEQIDEALQTSQILLQSEELAGNFYGVMKTYENIGQMHLQRKEYPQARSAFEQGLKFAQQLQYDESYFTQQIQQIPTN